MRFAKRPTFNLTVGNPTGDHIFIGGPEGMPTSLINKYAASVIVGGQVNFDGPNDYTYSVYVNPPIGRSFLAVGGMESVGLTVREAYRVIPGFSQVDMLVQAEAALDIDGDFNIDSSSAPRGVRFYLSRQTDVGLPVGGQNILNGNMSWVQGRAYKVSIATRINPAGTTTSLWIDNNGVKVWDMGTIGAISYTPSVHYEQVFIRNSASGIQNVAFKGSAAAGLSFLEGRADSPTYFMIEDIGAAANFTNAIAI